MRQAAIAVYDPDGAYEAFKKIKQFVKTEALAQQALKFSEGPLFEELILRLAAGDDGEAK